MVESLGLNSGQMTLGGEVKRLGQTLPVFLAIWEVPPLEIPFPAPESISHSGE